MRGARRILCVGNPGVDQQMGNTKLSFLLPQFLRCIGDGCLMRGSSLLYMQKKKSDSVGENNGNRLLLPYPTTPSGSFGFESWVLCQCIWEVRHTLLKISLYIDPKSWRKLLLVGRLVNYLDLVNWWTIAGFSKVRYAKGYTDVPLGTQM